MRRTSLFWKLAGTLLLVLLASAVLHSILIVLFFEPMVERWSEQRARNTAGGLVRDLEQLPPGAPRDSLASLLRAAGTDPGGLRYVFVPDSGGVVFGALSPHRFRRGFLRDFERSLARTDSGAMGSMRVPRAPDGRRRRQQDMRIVVRRPVNPGGNYPGELLAVSYRPPFPFWPGSLSRRALLLLPLTLTVAGAGGLLIFRMIARRLKALEELASRVAAGRFDARVTDTGTDEIGRLGARLNEMTERLEAARRSQDLEEDVRRQLLADISHELATPLTAIRAQAETMLDANVPLTPDERVSYLRGVLAEADRMNRLIQDLLELTRLEAGATPLDLESLDAAALVRNVVERFRPRYAGHGLTLDWQGDDAAATVRADGRRLEQVIENLLMNGLRHVTRDGNVRVSVRHATSGVVRIEVADDGPGLPALDRDRIFDRFYRADVSRSAPGSGLGLAIVREIVHRLGGAVRAEARGTGTAFIIDLPVDQ